MKSEVVELVKYGIIGGFTTIINWVVFAIGINYLSLSWEVANGIAWIISVAFAFWGNRTIVFQSQNDIKREVVAFFLLRVVILIFEYILLYVFFDVFNLDEMVTKIIVNSFVIIANYGLCKLSIFSNKKDSTK